jgi:hypothetical protein
MDRRERRPVDDRWSREPGGSRRLPPPGGGRLPPAGEYGWEPPGPPRRETQVAGIRITPTRVLLALALVGSLAYLAFAISVRDASSIPLLASGAAILGLVFAGLAAAGAFSTLQAGREGADGRAFAMAILGGLCAIAAFGCWAAAVVFILVSQSAP